MKRFILLLVMTALLVGLVGSSVAAMAPNTATSVQLMPLEMQEIVGGDTGCFDFTVFGVRCVGCCLDLWIIEICIYACWPV